jgi:hypothetical protein
MPTLDSTMLVTIAKQLNLISVFCYLLPIAVCIRRWQALLPLHRKFVLFALTTLLGINILSEVARQIWQNNIIFIYLSIWLETLFLSYAYYQTFTSRLTRQILVFAVVIFVVTALSEYIFWSGLYGTKTYTRMAQSILLIGAALMYFEKILRELRNIRLERDPMFLVSVGVTLYYSGTLMVFILEDSMQRDHQINQIWIMYGIQATLLIIFNILLSLALRNTTSAPAQALSASTPSF